VAGGGDGEASEASKWEYRECEEQLAFLRKRKSLGWGVRFLSVTCHLSFVFIFPTCSGGQRAGGPAAAQVRKTIDALLGGIQQLGMLHLRHDQSKADGLE